jgi:phosphate transport system permease protein
VPLGVLAAVCLSDVLPFTLRQAVKPVIEILAAIPSVAYGFFALVVFAPFLQSLGAASGTNALNVSIILGIMALPTVVSVSEDALQAVGRELREGSYALGATRAETILRVVIPAAGSGILAAVILGVMRAIGETMVVWMASGNAAQIPEPWFNLLEPVRTLTATIAGDMGEADHVTGSARYHVLFAMALSLLAISFAGNLASEWISRRSLKKLGK